MKLAHFFKGMLSQFQVLGVYFKKARKPPREGKGESSYNLIVMKRPATNNIFKNHGITCDWFSPKKKTHPQSWGTLPVSLLFPYFKKFWIGSGIPGFFSLELRMQVAPGFQWEKFWVTLEIPFCHPGDIGILMLISIQAFVKPIMFKM